MTRVSYLGVAFAALLSLALAQDTTLTTTASSPIPTDTVSATSTSTQPITQTVAVGRGGHTFIPDVIQISPGNYVEFDFYPTNHSVIRAEYLYPCIPYEMTGVDKIGFFSGFEPVDAILPDPPKFRILINDTNPIFFYCGAPNSCIQFQMVGVINPNASTSLVVQRQYAANSSFMLLPGENWPSEDNPFQTTSTSTSTATATYVTTLTSSTVPPSATAAPTSTSANDSAAAASSGHSSLSAGAIAGIAIGAAAVAIAAAVLLFICGRRSRRNKVNGGVNGGAGGGAGVPAPPAYMSGPPTAYGYMSPTGTAANKHMSISSSMPVTDAFGNPTPTAALGGMYHPFPQQQQQGGGMYGAPQHMQINPMMAPTPPVWPSSPSNDIFGATPPPSQMQMQGQQPLMNGSTVPGSGGGTDAPPSLRASSPSSVNPMHPTAIGVGGMSGGGIEAFLQRHQGGRMSPTPETDLHAQSNSPLLSNSNNEQQYQHQHQNQLPPHEYDGTGPYEMSATATMSRSP